MELYIDTRAGSNKLIDKFEGAIPTTLEFGDVMFLGNGPEDTNWCIGIEYKTVKDIVACIKSGRFTGTQLPGMLQTYDMSFLLIEGIAYPDPKTGQLVQHHGNTKYPVGLPYYAYDNFLTSVGMFSAISGKPCIVKRSGNATETVRMISNVYNYFQKPWNEHTSIKTPDRTKMQNVVYEVSIGREPEPGEPEYPEHILRKAVFQIDRVGWKAAGAISSKFKTLEALLAATQKDIVDDGVGAILAERIYQTFHGRPDPTIKKRARKLLDSSGSGQ